ncbi:MAG: rod shape-determining protein RodA [Chitinophagaceae bacterium]|nr:rod shape-determining protein RodA [Anaerolineae bacterium]
MRSLNFWRQFDYILLFTCTILIVFGILMIRSATTGAVDPDLIARVPDQIRYGIIGLLLVFGLAAMDYRLLGSLHFWLYIVMLILLMMVFFFGVEGDGGARSWLNLGIRIQPAELAKIIIIITLAHHLSQRYQKMHKLSIVLGSLIHIAIPTGLIFVQPDLGTTIVFIVIWLTMIWSAGLTFKHIGLFLLVIVIAAPAVWSQMQPYQRQRLVTFIAKDADPDNYFNIRQASISIGSGGFVGKGYANGSQNQLRFLRVRHTDFIFAVISEEFGFIGAVSIIILITIVIMRILRGARLAVDPLGSMICYGVATIIFFQTFVSIGMNLELLPVTGLTLPFVSSGGTALLSTLIGVGLAQSVIVRRRRF